jgi:hypothetical protein
VISKSEPHISYRFVVLYRREPREIGGAAEEWRGWVQRVPEPTKGVSAEEGDRVWFGDLKDLSDAVRSLMEPIRSEEEGTGRKKSRRRPCRSRSYRGRAPARSWPRRRQVWSA